jgi:hypothetical protein
MGMLLFARASPACYLLVRHNFSKCKILSMRGLTTPGTGLVMTPSYCFQGGKCAVMGHSLGYSCWGAYID